MRTGYLGRLLDDSWKTLSVAAPALLFLAACSGSSADANGLAASEVDAAPLAETDAGTSLPDTGLEGSESDASQAALGSFTVGGTVTGLVGSGLVLELNGGELLPIAADGEFTFTRKLASGGDYNVNVRTRPTQPSQLCTVTHGGGKIGTNNVTDVAITCSTSSFAVGGKVIGLAGKGLALKNSGGDDLAVVKDGTFRFATKMASGAPYDVTVQSQPSFPTQTCTVANGHGTVGSVDVDDVEVTCATNAYTVGGTIEGLSGRVILANGGGGELTVTANGSFTFAQKVSSGASYAVTVKTQPETLGETCTVENGSGTIKSADVSDVHISCTTTKHTIGGTIEGGARPLVLLNNGTDSVSITSRSQTKFWFGNRLAKGQSYDVTVAVSPAEERCSVKNGKGTVGDADILNVVIVCP